LRSFVVRALALKIEFGEFIVSKTSSGVLILFQKLSVNEAIEALILVWQASTAEE